MPDLTLADVATFSIVLIREVSNPNADDDDRAWEGSTVVVWTGLTSADDELAPYELRGLLLPTSDQLLWLPDDTLVDVVREPAMLAHPEDLIQNAHAARTRAREVFSPGDYPELVEMSDPVMDAVDNTTDPEIAVENLLLALNVAPQVSPLRDLMIAALAARLATVLKDPDTYPTDRHPWSRIARRT